MDMTMKQKKQAPLLKVGELNENDLALMRKAHQAKLRADALFQFVQSHLLDTYKLTDSQTIIENGDIIEEAPPGEGDSE